MKSRSLLIVGALMLALVPVPAAAGAQRGSGRHHGGRAIARPLVIVGQPVAVRPMVVVVPPVVVGHPVIGRSVPPRSFGRSSFRSIPVRTGFGTTPVRTGFGVEARLAPVPVTIGRPHGFKSKGFRAHKAGRVVGGTIVVDYPVPYSYAYAPPYDVTTSSAGHPSRPSNITVYGADGVSAGLSTHSADLANETSASGGLNFEVSPAVAEVYVDGIYMGTVQDFSADDEPLRVAPGSHRIELRAPGYRTSTFDVNIAVGQVTPYQGALERLRRY
jgi:PEGA domain